MRDDDTEARLRASLHRHAQDAPPAEPVAERALRAVHSRGTSAIGPVRRRGFRPRLRAWSLPLAAAAAVVAVVGGVVAIEAGGGGHHGRPLAETVAPAPARTTSGSSATAQPGPSAAGSVESAPYSSSLSAVPADLHDVHIIDATFAGADDGWLLVRATCLSGPGDCSAMIRTTDGGRVWTSVKPPPANVAGVKGCAAPCIEHIRFANARTGYAFGPQALLMTTDGGQTWRRLKGGAVALETLDDNVIRVTATPSGCEPPGCGYTVATSAIGSTTWTSRGLPAPVSGGMTTGAQLVRSGHDAYVLVLGHPAGGAQNAWSTLYRSSNDGRTWQRLPSDPCPQAGGEVDATAVSAGQHGRVAVLCVPRLQPADAFLARSSDGTTFTASTGQLAVEAAGELVGDPATVLLATGGAGTGSSSGSAAYRSTDGGMHWTRLTQLGSAVSWIGFESTTVGRAVSGAGTLWTTRDAGATWTPTRFD